MKKVQERFAVQVPEMPDQIDISTYSKYKYMPFVHVSRALY